MKTSMKWLSHYVDLPWSAAELAERLTLAGLEVEDIHETATVPEGVVIAEILARNPHPNADRLSLCDVSVGPGSSPLRVVCGAPNCDAGAKVPLATIGTVLGDAFTVKKAKLRGEASYGMLCSARELGLGSDHSGLLILPQDAPVGTPLGEMLGSDTIIDWEVTPNRPDWLCHIGIAREIAAVGDCRETFRLPPIKVEETGNRTAADLTAVEVRAPDLCPRYVARLIRNVRVEPSPKWMQDALTAVGIRPINNIVDITNYVLMECGQPLHAFDFDLLAGGRIVVRRAEMRETITTLDDQTHELTPDTLLIADAERGVALAGIMGGADSEISAKTTTVLLESAVFLAANIRATAKQLGISTEASYRFERGLDIEMTEFASLRAAKLMCDLAGGELVPGKIDAYAAPAQPRTVTCRVQRASQLLGVDVSGPQMATYFTRLGLDVAAQDEVQVAVRVPPFRLDLEREADLIEEVARLYGLGNIAPAAADALVGGPMASDTYYPLQEAREQLLGLGLTESVTYSLLSIDSATRGGDVAAADLVILANPLSAEAACLRASLLPSLLQTVANNIAHDNSDLALFEIGRVVSAGSDVAAERHQAGIVLTGRRHPELYGQERECTYDFFDIKGILESWFAARRLTGCQCRSAEHPAFTADACAGFFGDGARVAVLGRIDPNLTQDIRLKHPLLVALVELESLMRMAPRPLLYEPLPQFPSVARDISLVADETLPNQAIIDTVLSTDCDWLEDVALFDVYQDEKGLGPGRRSLAYALTYRSTDKTLTDAEVNTAHERIRDALRGLPGVELR